MKGLVTAVRRDVDTHEVTGLVIQSPDGQVKTYTLDQAFILAKFGGGLAFAEDVSIKVDVGRHERGYYVTAKRRGSHVDELANIPDAAALRPGAQVIGVIHLVNDITPKQATELIIKNDLDEIYTYPVREVISYLMQHPDRDHQIQVGPDPTQVLTLVGDPNATASDQFNDGKLYLASVKDGQETKALDNL